MRSVIRTSVNCDGSIHRHEVHLSKWRASTPSTHGYVLEAASWYEAREAARLFFGTDCVTVEAVET